MKRIIYSLCVISGAVCSSDTFAESKDISALTKSVEALTKTVTSLQKTVLQQEQEIAALKKVSVSATPVSVVPSASVPKIGSSGSYVPEIGVVADIVGTSSGSKEDDEGNDRISAREVELVLGHDVDPYSRLDATIAFSDSEEAALEEAYASYWDLPLDSKLRVGRFHPKYGRAASVHRDSLDTVDEPLVVQRYFGVEGATHSGVDVTGFTPLSGDSFTQQLTIGVMEGGNGEDGFLFGDSRRVPTVYARVSNALDISDETNSEIGATWLNGSSDNDSAREVDVLGVDASLNHFFTPQNKFKLLTEAYIRGGTKNFENKDLSITQTDRPFGYYVLADYRLSERWGAGMRWDWVEPVASESALDTDHEHALSEYLTFYQSEFARWRLQYERIYGTDSTDDNKFFLQGTFAIGTHKHTIQ